MDLILDDQGYAVLRDGQPLYEHNGKRQPFDASAAVEKIKAQAESIETYKASVAQLDDDLGKWQALGELADVRKAVALLREMDPEEAVAAAAKVVELEAQLAEATGDNKTKAAEIHELTIGNAFAHSAWISENLVDAFANQPSRLRALYASNFKLEDGEIVGYDDQSKQLYSLSRPGEKASFPESLDQLCSKDMKRSSGAKGSNAPADDGKIGGRFSYVRSKAQLGDSATKAEYIDSEGLDKFMALPVGR